MAMSPWRRAKYCDHCVCMFVQTSRNFLHMLPVTEARSSSDDNAIRYVLPVLWMMLCFRIIGICGV